MRHNTKMITLGFLGFLVQQLETWYTFAEAVIILLHIHAVASRAISPVNTPTHPCLSPHYSSNQLLRLAGHPVARGTNVLFKHDAVWVAS